MSCYRKIEQVVRPDATMDDAVLGLFAAIAHDAIARNVAKGEAHGERCMASDNA